jgi:AzlC protein
LSGAAQLAATQLVTAAALAIVIVLTVLIISLRLTVYGTSLAPHFQSLSAGWKGLTLTCWPTRPTVTITRFDDGGTKEPDKRWYFLGVALTIEITRVRFSVGFRSFTQVAARLLHKTPVLAFLASGSQGFTAKRVYVSSSRPRS